MNVKKRRAEIKKEIVESVCESINSLEYDVDDEAIREIIDDAVLSNESASGFEISALVSLAESVFYCVRCELGILTPLVNDSSITEIMVNGPENIFVEKNGSIEKTNLYFDTAEELEDIIRRIASSVHREVNEMSPILDARLQNGSRVNAVYKNIALGGPSLSIRKFPETALTIEDLIKFGSITREAAEYLEKLVKARYSLFISGGTSSGKTTFLNVLSDFISEDKRTIVIEDSSELQLRNLKNVVRLECRNANVHGKGEIDMEALIKNSLRMRPDWIIVGEVRGKECTAMLQAMNTGHSGMSTGHANSVRGMLRRLEAMYLQKHAVPIESIRQQIAQGIEIIVHLGRIDGKGRKVLEIAEIEGLNENEFIINTIFKYKLNEGLVPTGNILVNREKLEMAGVDL